LVSSHHGGRVENTDWMDGVGQRLKFDPTPNPMDISPFAMVFLCPRAKSNQKIQFVLNPIAFSLLK